MASFPAVGYAAVQPTVPVCSDDDYEADASFAPEHDDPRHTLEEGEDAVKVSPALLCSGRLPCAVTCIWVDASW